MRYGVSATLAAFYLLFAALYLWHRPLYDFALYFLDGLPNKPYGDTWAVLQANLCWHQGVDVYRSNACMGGGQYNYTLFLLRLGVLPPPGDVVAAALVQAFLFIAGLALLPPPQSGIEWAWRAVAACSGSTAFLLASANMDSDMVLLVLLGLLCLLRAGGLRWLGYALFALGGAVKFYPLALGALLLRERRGEIGLAAALAAAGGLVVWVRYGAGIVTALNILPMGMPFTGLFGALNLGFGLQVLLNLPVLALVPSPAQFLHAIGTPSARFFLYLLPRLMIFASLIRGYYLATRYAKPLAEMPADKRLFLLAGAITISFCFCLAQNYEYRAVYLLLALPGLWLLRGGLFTVTLLLLWEGTFRQLAGLGGVYPAIAEWLVREALWWWLVTQFFAMLFAFVTAEGRRILAPAA